MVSLEGVPCHYRGEEGKCFGFHRPEGETFVWVYFSHNDNSCVSYSVIVPIVSKHFREINSALLKREHFELLELDDSDNYPV